MSVEYNWRDYFWGISFDEWWEHIEGLLAQYDGNIDQTILGIDYRYWQSFAITHAKNLSEDTLAILAHNENQEIRDAVARRTNNEDILAMLAEDESWQIRFLVASRTINKVTLAKLSLDENALTRLTATRRLNELNTQQLSPSRRRTS